MLVVSALMLVPARSETDCWSSPDGRVDQGQTSIWMERVARQEPAAMTVIAGKWATRTVHSDKTMSLITVSYLADGTMRLVLRNCSAETATDCREVTGTGLWTAHQVRDETYAMARRFDAGDVRNFCDASDITLKDANTAVTPEGVVASRIP